MKLVLPWSFVKEYVGEILKSFNKFQLVPSSMEVFTTKLNGPLAPTVSRPSEGRAGRDNVGTGCSKRNLISTAFRHFINHLENIKWLLVIEVF